MKGVTELNREQLTELKQNWYTEFINEKEGRSPYMSELVDIDSIVSDSDIMEEYKNTSFSNDDFCCSSGNVD